MTTFDAILAEVNTRAEAADALGSTLKFDLGEGQVIYLDGSGENNVVSTEDKDAQCTVGIDMADLAAMLSGSLNPMTAFMEQKLKIDGDMGVAMKLQSIVA